MSKSKNTQSLTLALILLLMTISIHAEVPQVLNYQGILTNSGGEPVADGSYQVVFTIYDAATVGNSKWTETQSITTSNGLFAVLLGTINPIIDTVFSGTTRYLSIEVAGDPEMTPRTALVSVPYAQRVSTVDGASGGNVTSKLSVGSGHTLSGDSAGIGGGYNNVASGSGSTVGGGNGNTADGTDASVAGGQNNSATGYCSTVGGGSDNTSSNNYSTVAGGTNNSVTNGYSVIAGGIQNSVSGNYSAILGGFADTITSSYSYLFGINSNLAQDSTFRVEMPHIKFGSDDSSYEFPTGDGTSGQILATDGIGQLGWADPGSGSGSGDITSVHPSENGGLEGGADEGAVELGIEDYGVSSDKIATGAVTSAKIFDGTILNSDINPSAEIEPIKIKGTAVNLSDAQTISGAKTFEDLNISTTIRRLAIPSCAFVPAGGSISYTRSGGYLSNNSTTTAWYFAPVFLPGGATVTDVKMTFHDNDLNYGGSFFFYKTYVYSAGEIQMASGVTTGTPGLTTIVDNTIDSETISNDGYNYYLWVMMRYTSNPGDMRLYGAEIVYTISKPLP